MLLLMYFILRPSQFRVFGQTVSSFLGFKYNKNVRIAPLDTQSREPYCLYYLLRWQYHNLNFNLFYFSTNKCICFQQYVFISILLLRVFCELKFRLCLMCSWQGLFPVEIWWKAFNEKWGRLWKQVQWVLELLVVDMRLATLLVLVCAFLIFHFYVCSMFYVAYNYCKISYIFLLLFYRSLNLFISLS